MGTSKFGQISGTLNNGGKFYTAAAMAYLELEAPGGVAGVTETSLASYTALFTTASASLSQALDAELLAYNNGVAYTALSASTKTAISSSLKSGSRI